MTDLEALVHANRYSNFVNSPQLNRGYKSAPQVISMAGRSITRGVKDLVVSARSTVPATPLVQRTTMTAGLHS
jgi:hypothetical protein